MRFDTGGTGKGLAADLLASRLDGRWAIDCGGDIRVGGAFDDRGPPPAHRSETIHTLHVEDGAVATSGIDTRLWRHPTARRAITCSTRPRASPPGPA